MKQKIADKVSKKLIIALALVNGISILFIGGLVRGSVSSVEERYVKEIATNISSEIDLTMDLYISVAEVLAQNTAVIEIMEQSNKSQPMHDNNNASTLTAELSKIAAKYPSSVASIALLDIEQDGYLIHDGGYSDDSFSFASRPYYASVTNKKTFITSPYLDVSTGQMVVAIASPVFNQGGEVLGIVLIDLSTQFMSELMINSLFGNSGECFVLDENHLVLAHEDVNMLGKGYAELGINDTGFTKALSAGSSDLVGFNLGGKSSQGIVTKIDGLNWTVVSSLSSFEFYTDTIVIIAVVIGIMVLAVIIASAMSKKTVTLYMEPLGELNDAMKELANGNLHCEIHHTSDDEIGELSENITETSAALSTYISEISRQLDILGNGNFVVESKVEFIGDFRFIQSAIHSFSSMISSTLVELKDMIDQVAVESDSVATGSLSLAEGTQNQADGVASLKDYIQNVSNSVKENASNAVDMTKKAQAIADELVETNRIMSTMVASMEDLNEKSEGIKNIVATIQDIAEQTAILSLNASIEAARAGQAGGGFAVVATEVRNLANQTSIAVQNTDDLINSTREGIMKGNELADNTASDLKEVTENVADFMETIQTITQTSKEQSEAIGEINDNIQQISSVMQNNSAISEESAAISEELSSQTTLMKNVIDKFRLH